MMVISTEGSSLGAEDQLIARRKEVPAVFHRLFGARRKGGSPDAIPLLYYNRSPNGSYSPLKKFPKRCRRFILSLQEDSRPKTTINKSQDRLACGCGGAPLAYLVLI